MQTIYRLIRLSLPRCAQIKVEEYNAKWKGTVILGAIANYLTSTHLPSSAILLRRPCWLITHDYLNINGSRMQCSIGEQLLKIRRGTIITLTLTHANTLTLQIDDKYLEEIASGLPHHVHPIFDLYGKCERISLINTDNRNSSPVNDEIIASTSIDADHDRNVQLEKADLEVHEKETEAMQSVSDCIPTTSFSATATATPTAMYAFDNFIFW